jgi:hypothetical protein
LREAWNPEQAEQEGKNQLGTMDAHSALSAALLAASKW